MEPGSDVVTRLRQRVKALEAEVESSRKELIETYKKLEVAEAKLHIFYQAATNHL